MFIHVFWKKKNHLCIKRSVKAPSGTFHFSRTHVHHCIYITSLFQSVFFGVFRYLLPGHPPPSLFFCLERNVTSRSSFIIIQDKILKVWSWNDETVRLYFSGKKNMYNLVIWKLGFVYFAFHYLSFWELKNIYISIFEKKK